MTTILFRLRRIPALTVATLAVVVFSIASPAHADTKSTPYSGCGANQYVQSIDVHDDVSPDFKVSVMPTDLARNTDDPELTNSMWHQVQSCVSGLYGRLADSIYQQLQCHNLFPYEWATGPTYDLESWHAPLSPPSIQGYAQTHCLNTLNVGQQGVGINFPGSLDNRYGNVG